MTLPEIGPGKARRLCTDIRRRGPWGARFARSGNFEPHTTPDLTRRWAVGPANYSFVFFVLCSSFLFLFRFFAFSLCEIPKHETGYDGDGDGDDEVEDEAAE